MAVKINPRRIVGRWSIGYVLDYHTLSSTYLGDDEFGNRQFETLRTPIGELLYRFKYQNDETAGHDIIGACERFLQRTKPQFDLIVPVPPSKLRRTRQPVYYLAEELDARLDIPVVRITRRKGTPELKNVFGLEERLKALDNAYTSSNQNIVQKRVLVFDDLYRSGATLNSVTTFLLDNLRAAAIVAMAVTRTRSNA